MTPLLWSIAAAVVVVIILMTMSLRQVQQYERGVVLRFGRLLPRLREPGLRVLVPVADRMIKVSIQTIVLSVPTQGAITRDNVTVDVSAVACFQRPGPGARPPRLPGSRVLGGHPAHGWTPVPRISTGRPGLS